MRHALAFLALAALSTSARAEPCRTSSGVMPAIDSSAPMTTGDAPRMHCEQRDGGTLGGVQTHAWEFTVRDSAGREVERQPGAVTVQYYMGKNLGAPGAAPRGSSGASSDRPQTYVNRNGLDPSRTGRR